MTEDQRLEELSEGCKKVYDLICQHCKIIPDPETPERMARGLLAICTYPEVDEKLFGFETAHRGSGEGILTFGPVRFMSLCDHHMLPFLGEAWVTVRIPRSGRNAYQVLGISKLGRIVRSEAARPNLQEAMTERIATRIQEALRSVHPTVTYSAVESNGEVVTWVTDNVGGEVLVTTRAKHLCVYGRGLEDHNADLECSFYLGKSDATAREDEQILGLLSAHQAASRGG